jgi:hypothetical protein
LATGHERIGDLVLADDLRRCARRQVSQAAMSGGPRSSRIRSRGGSRLISRSIANKAWMRSTTSVVIGALLII